MASKDVTKDKESQVWKNLYEKNYTKKGRKRSKFSVADFVKLSIEKALFMKRYQDIWTGEVLTIDTVVYGNPTT